MANTPIAMNKLRNTLRLYTEGKGKKFIASYLGLSRNTVRKYIDRFTQSRLTYQEVQQLTDRKLYETFQLGEEKEVPDKMQVLLRFFPRMQRELKRPGVTRLLMWEEYIGKYPDGYGKTQFYRHYKKWQGTDKPAMHVDHKAGDKMYVDYAGKKLQIIDPVTGECQSTEVFVAILGASQLIYVEASMSQRKDDFVTSVENALLYYGGVPQAIVPDNLKSAVKKSHRYEPTLNETFEDFAEHYDTVVLPARVYKPKDKALVEGAVKIVYSTIYAQLRNKQFFNLQELNTAIHSALEALNDRPFRNRKYSRRELFNQVERDLLKPLTAERYQIKENAWATVMKTGHVLLQPDKHYYSVPYKFIGRKVKLVWSATNVSIYYNYERIAFHKRTKSAYHYTTEEEHLASTHKFITNWNPDYFRKWAADIHPNVEMLIVQILEKKKYPEQAYRSCMGVLSLGKKVGKKRLTDACTRALEYGICNYKIVQNILEKGLDKNDTPAEDNPSLPGHDNIRGKQYYN